MRGAQAGQRRLALRLGPEHADEHLRGAQVGACLDGGHGHESDSRVLEVGAIAAPTTSRRTSLMRRMRPRASPRDYSERSYARCSLRSSAADVLEAEQVALERHPSGQRASAKRSQRVGPPLDLASPTRAQSRVERCHLSWPRSRRPRPRTAAAAAPSASAAACACPSGRATRRSAANLDQADEGVTVGPHASSVVPDGLGTATVRGSHGWEPLPSTPRAQAMVGPIRDRTRAPSARGYSSVCSTCLVRKNSSTSPALTSA